MATSGAALAAVTPAAEALAGLAATAAVGRVARLVLLLSCGRSAVPDLAAAQARAGDVQSMAGVEATSLYIAAAEPVLLSPPPAAAAAEEALFLPRRSLVQLKH